MTPRAASHRPWWCDFALLALHERCPFVDDAAGESSDSIPGWAVGDRGRRLARGADQVGGDAKPAAATAARSSVPLLRGGIVYRPSGMALRHRPHRDREERD